MKRIKKGQKAQSEIITTILLILLVLVAIIIVWQVVKRTVVTGTEGIGTGAFTTQLEIQDAKLWVTGGAEVKVHRGAGEGEITSLKFIFEKADGETEIITRKAPDYEMPDELETKVYDFTPDEINEKIEKVSLAPLFGNNAGITVYEDERKIEKDSSGERILDAPDDNSMVSWWRFDGNARDSVGGNHGTAYGGTNTNGNVLNLDGVDDYVEINDDDSLDIGVSNFTISVWIKRESFASRMFLVDKYNPSLGISLEFSSSDNIRALIYNGTMYEIVTTNAYTDKNWYNIIWKRDSDTAYLYVNNVLKGTVDGVDNVDITNNLDLNLGRYQFGNDFFFNGSIDDVMIFNKALSEDEIKAIYNNQMKG